MDDNDIMLDVLALTWVFGWVYVIYQAGLGDW